MGNCFTKWVSERNSHRISVVKGDVRRVLGSRALLWIRCGSGSGANSINGDLNDCYRRKEDEMETKTVIGKEAGVIHVRWMVGLYRSDNVCVLSVFGRDSGVVLFVF